MVPQIVPSLELLLADEAREPRQLAATKLHVPFEVMFQRVDFTTDLAHVGWRLNTPSQLSYYLPN